ncbi:membrane protein [Afipia sp. P52-10]|uniref:hypothetical protein n=1 Tax=Afipia sp. P52-10 TaxID=1429916 RepID=UPI0003DF2CC3|nr:hypothetical protein [Afipia sp. P52-10]ETR77331.1 membrane protein [Afipia sp. P52-10]
MAITLQQRNTTRAFARVIGPWLLIVPGVIVLRLPQMERLLAAFIASELFAWFAGALLLLCGLLIIALHQFWSSVSAVLISLFGWFLALRGLVLLVAPQWIERAATGLMGQLLLVRLIFIGLFLIGLWLTVDGWILKPPTAD